MKNKRLGLVIGVLVMVSILGLGGTWHYYLKAEKKIVDDLFEVENVLAQKIETVPLFEAFFEDELFEVRTLSLRDSSVADKHLRSLANLTSLRTLSFRHTSITDDGLKHLEPLISLQNLDLCGTKVSDASIDSLSLMVALKHLSLISTNFTEIGIKKLQAVLPHCEIDGP